MEKLKNCLLECDSLITCTMFVIAENSERKITGNDEHSIFDSCF